MRGIGDGTLDKERFRFWIRQDYLFLIEYSRLLALAAARAPDLDTTGRFADLLHETLHEEMQLHRSYCSDLGIAEADLEREQLAPTTRGYTDFMLRTATVGDFAELLAALLPCTWGFNEIGLRLNESARLDDQHYAQWIEMYASDEFTALVDWLRALTDRIGADLTGAARERGGTSSLPAAATNSPSGTWPGRWRTGRRPTGLEPQLPPTAARSVIAVVRSPATGGYGSPCKTIYGSYFDDQIDAKVYPAVRQALHDLQAKAPNARIAILG